MALFSPQTTRNALEKYLILRSDFVHTTFSYWPALQPAPIYKLNLNQFPSVDTLRIEHLS